MVVFGSSGWVAPGRARRDCVRAVLGHRPEEERLRTAAESAYTVLRVPTGWFRFSLPDANPR